MGVSWTVRSVRAAVFAVVCVLLAAGGHTLATGSAPPLWVDAAAFLPVFAAGAALAGRECALPGIAFTMLVVQGGLHLAFGAAGSAYATDTAGMTGMPMRMTGMPPGTYMTGDARAMTSHALGAHLIAALAASWCLRRGEAALWSLLRKAAAAVVPALTAGWRGWRTAPLPSYARPPRPRAHCRRFLRQTLLRHAVYRRGPPLGSPYPT